MAQRRRKKEPNSSENLEVLAAERDELSLEDQEQRALDVIEGALAENGSDGFVCRVHQIENRPGQRPGEPWIFDADIAELEGIRPRLLTEYGPGRYRIRVNRNRRLFRQYDIEIAVSRATAAAMRAPAPAFVAAPAGDLPPAVVAMLDRMERNQTALLERLAQSQQAPSPAGAMEQALGMMKMFKELMPQAAAPNIGFDMFKQAFDLAREIAPAREEGGGLSSLVGKLIESPLLKAMVEKAYVPGAAPGGQVALPPWADDGEVPVPAAPLPAALSRHQPAPANAPAWHGGAPAPAANGALPPALQEVRDYLLAEARRGADPAMAADYAQERIPNELFDAMEKYQGEPVDLLIQLFPEAAPHRPWFARLIENLYEGEDTGGDAKAANDVPVPGPASTH